MKVLENVIPPPRITDIPVEFFRDETGKWKCTRLTTGEVVDVPDYLVPDDLRRATGISEPFSSPLHSSDEVGFEQHVEDAVPAGVQPF